MRKIYLILVVGAVLLVGGMISLQFIASSLQQDFTSTLILIQDEAIPPLGSYLSDFYMEKGTNQTLAVINSKPQSLIGVQISNPEGTLIENASFHDKFAVTIEPEIEGVYQLALTNFGDSGVTVSSIITTDPVIEMVKQFIELTIQTIASFVSISIGFITLIIGGIFFVYDWKKTRTQSRSISKK